MASSLKIDHPDQSNKAKPTNESLKQSSGIYHSPNGFSVISKSKINDLLTPLNDKLKKSINSSKLNQKANQFKLIKKSLFKKKPEFSKLIQKVQPEKNQNTISGNRKNISSVLIN